MTPWRSDGWLLVRSGLIAGVVAALVLPFLLGLNLLATYVDRRPILDHVRRAYAAGDLQLDTRASTDTRRGTAQFTDCLILMMILDQRGSHWRRALSPSGDLQMQGNPCEALHRFAEEGRPPAADLNHRYLHGLTALATFETAALPIGRLRQTLSRLGFLAVAGLIAVSAWRLAAAREGDPEGSGEVRAAFGLLAGVALLLFWGLQFYGMSISHAPSDWLLIGYAYLAVLVDLGRTPPWRSAVLHAGFGALAAYLEYFTGVAPLGACLVLYAHAAVASRAEPRAALVRALAALCAFVVGAGTTLALKVAVTMQMFGAQAVLHQFVTMLAFRVGGGRVALWQEGLALIGSGEYIGEGWPPLGVALLLLTALGFAASAVRLLTHPPARSPRALLLLMSAACVYGWWAVFRQHTFQHAFFAVRIGAGLVFSVTALTLCLFGRPLARMAGGLLARWGERAPPTAA